MKTESKLYTYEYPNMVISNPAKFNNKYKLHSVVLYVNIW